MDELSVRASDFTPLVLVVNPKDLCVSFLNFRLCLSSQRDEAKCPALPHSCTCTQDSIGPQGPPGPSVKTPVRPPHINAFLSVCCFYYTFVSDDKLFLHFDVILSYKKKKTFTGLTIHWIRKGNFLFFPMERAEVDETSGTLRNMGPGRSVKG